MKKIDQITALENAIRSISESVELFYQYENLFTHESTEENKALFMSMRDSMIKRFKYTTDLLWKVIKNYLEKQGVSILIPSPRGIIREAVRVKLLSETEGEACMEVVESRNKTSHTYHELTADEIAHEIPGYYELIKKLSDRIKMV